MSNIKNYQEQGGEKWTVGGELAITTGGKLTFQEEELKPAKGQADSDASSVASLKADFNDLLAKLFAAGLMVVDKSALAAAITSAQELLDSAVVGSDPGEYPQGDYDTFSAAIDTAQAVADDAEADQNQVATATSTLEAAVSTFEDAEIEE